MRTVLALIPTISLIVSAQAVQIQDQPDFSGRWKLSGSTVPDADFPAALTVRQLIADKTARGEAMTPYFKEVTVERELAGATARATYQIGVQGGRVSGVGPRTGAPSQETRFFVRWEGRRLVFETGRYEGPVRMPESPAELRAGTYSERVETWELGPDGLLTISITTRGSNVETTTKSATYVRN